MNTKRLSTYQLINLSTLVLFLFIFAVYLYTLCPTVSVGDSGEFITAAATLSLAHPPSYPLYSLLGKLFITFIPFGNIAYRINLMSVFFAVLTLFLLFKLTTSHYSLITILILAFSPLFWLQSLVSEVFTLNCFFATLLIFVLLTNSPIHQFTNYRFLYLFSFLFGLGLGNHHTLVLLLPGFAYLIFKGYQGMARNSRGNQGDKKIPLLTRCVPERYTPRAIPLFSLCFLFFLLGFSIYLYLPIRSLQNPPLDWGNPETFRAFWRVITRADYGSMRLTLGGGEKSLSFFEQLSRFFLGLSKSYGTLSLILSFVALVALIWRRRDPWPGRLGIFLFLVFFFSGPFFILLANLPDSAESWAVVERFYLLPLLALTISLGYGLQLLFECLSKSRNLKFVLTLTLTLPFYSLLKNFPEVKRRNFLLAYDYGRNNFHTLSPRAYFIMEGGDDTFFTTAYLNYVEKRRTDITPFDRGGLIFAHPYGKDFRLLTREEKNKRREEVEGQLAISKDLPAVALAKAGRAVYYSTFNEKILPGFKLSQNGILYQVESKERRAESRTTSFWELYNLRKPSSGSLSEYRVRALAPIYPYLYGVYSQKSGDFERAIKEWNYACYLGEDVKWLKGNLIYLYTTLGIDYFNQKNYSSAEVCFQRAIELDPNYSLAYTNLGAVLEAKGLNEKAKEIYLKTIEIDPSAVDAYYNLAVVYWKEENWQKVVEYLEKVLEINPEHSGARRYLPQAELKLKKK